MTRDEVLLLVLCTTTVASVSDSVSALKMSWEEEEDEQMMVTQLNGGTAQLVFDGVEEVFVAQHATNVEAVRIS